MTDVQKRILDAANKLFSKSSYQDVSLRQIAEEAHVNASLIIRHFGSKDKLFLLSLKGTEEHDNTILEGPREDLGTTIVAKILDSNAKPHSPARNMGALLQAVGNDNLKEEMRLSTLEHIVKPLMKVMDGEDKELRATLAVAQISGLLVHLYVLNDPTLKDSEKQKLIDHYGAALQTLIDS